MKSVLFVVLYVGVHVSCVGCDGVVKRFLVEQNVSYVLIECLRWFCTTLSSHKRSPVVCKFAGGSQSVILLTHLFFSLSSPSYGQ